MPRSGGRRQVKAATSVVVPDTPRHLSQLGLPAELRLMIFTFLLVLFFGPSKINYLIFRHLCVLKPGAKINEVTITVPNHPQYGPFPDNCANRLAILRSCRQLCEEFTPAMCEVTLFMANFNQKWVEILYIPSRPCIGLRNQIFTPLTWQINLKHVQHLLLDLSRFQVGARSTNSRLLRFLQQLRRCAHLWSFSLIMERPREDFNYDLLSKIGQKVPSQVKACDHAFDHITLIPWDYRDYVERNHIEQLHGVREKIQPGHLTIHTRSNNWFSKWFFPYVKNMVLGRGFNLPPAYCEHGGT